MNSINLRENMRITKITSNMSLQSKPDLKPSSRLGLPAQHQEMRNTLVSMPYYQPSFGSIKIPPVAEALEGKGLRLAKKYLVKNDGELHVVIDKNSTLGENPILFFCYKDEEAVIDPRCAKLYGIDPNYKAKWVGDKMWLTEMRIENNGYRGSLGCATLVDKINYAVYYEDTKKWDNNGGLGYRVDPVKLINKAVLFDKQEHGKSLLRIIRSGGAKGKVVCEKALTKLLEKLPKTNEPVIAVVEDFNIKGEDELGYIPSNVKGVIFTKTAEKTLGHVAADVRNVVDASAIILDEKMIEELQNMEGRFIAVDVSKKGLQWHPIAKTEIEPSIAVRPVIQIPKIRTTDKLLASAEYESEIVGPKAFNLKRLEEMKQKGRLKNIEIPRSFAIPCGVYDKALAANPKIATNIEEKASEIDKMSDSIEITRGLKSLSSLIFAYINPEHLSIPNSIQQEIMEFKDKVGLGTKVMVRSAFNGEDAKGYSAAGLYSSHYCSRSNEESFFEDIMRVWRSKWNYRAYMSRKGNNISHDSIKPTVIVQDYVPADYGFTIYTKSPEDSKCNKLLIEMNPKISIEPYIIKYDRDTHEVEVESIARRGRKITLDEDMNVVDAEPINDPIKTDLERWKSKLKKVCEAALEVEKEFGAPQDIEGGIKFTNDGDVDTSQIYFWQAREQVL